MTYRLKLSLLLCSLTLASCGVFSSKPTGLQPKALTEVGNKLNTAITWQVNTNAETTDNYLKLTPKITDNKIITITPKGVITAYQLGSGKILWQNKTKKPLSGGPEVGEGLVLIGTLDGQLLAYNESDGELQWTATASSEILSTPQISDNLIAVRTVDGRVAGYQVATGERLWIYDREVPSLSLRGNSPPIMVDGAVISGFDNGWLVAINGVNGKPLWEKQIVEPRGRSDLERMVDLDANMIQVDDILYVSSYQGRTVALNLYSSEILWSRQYATHAGFAVDNGAVYLSDESSHLWAFDRHTGNSLWKQEALEGRELGAPVVVDDYIAVADYQGYIHWLDRESGKLVSRTKTVKTGIRTPLQVIDHHILALNNEGKMFYIRYGN